MSFGVDCCDSSCRAHCCSFSGTHFRRPGKNSKPLLGWARLLVAVRAKHLNSRGDEFVISYVRFEIGRFSVAWLILFVLGAGMACGTRVPKRELVLNVTNELGRTITEIRKKPCDDLELAFVPIEDSRLGPGETRRVALPPTCVDLVAFDSRGRVVGEMPGLTMLPDARWVLRR